MPAFRVSGSYEHGALKHVSRFQYEFLCASAEEARERALSVLGSRHRVRRRAIATEEVRPLAPGEATDPLVRRHLAQERAP